MPVNILIADDHPLFRVALRQAVNLAFHNAVIREAGSIDDVQRMMTPGCGCTGFPCLFAHDAVPG